MLEYISLPTEKQYHFVVQTCGMGPVTSDVIKDSGVFYCFIKNTAVLCCFL